MRTMLATVFLASVLLAVPAMAQQVDIEVLPPDRAREPIIIAPGDQYETGRPHDHGYYPEGPRVRYNPAYVSPLSVRTQTPTSTGRAGIAGWTAPNTPVGSRVSGWQEVSGWFALGLTIEWGGPPPAKRPAPPAPAPR
jgi:hypothetical protein